MDNYSNTSFNQNQGISSFLKQNKTGNTVSSDMVLVQKDQGKSDNGEQEIRHSVLDDRGQISHGRGDLIGEKQDKWKGEEAFRENRESLSGGNNDIISDQVNYNFNQAGQVIHKNKKRFKKTFSGSSLLKLIILIVLPIGLLGTLGTIFVSQAREGVYQEEKGILVSTPMKDVTWKDIGSVFEPIIELPIKIPGGYQKWDFLIDSGAVISSLPREWAEKTGQDIDLMKRSTFKGFGGMTSFAYQGEMVVLLGEEEVNLPVVFTEASATKSLLGRSGFFQNYSIYFNHRDKMIEIRK